MILHILVMVFVDGLVLMLGILNVMRGLYALGICQRPQISTDHLGHISMERFESQTHPTGRAMTKVPLLLNRVYDPRE